MNSSFEHNANSLYAIYVEEALESVPKFKGGDPSVFVRSCKRAAKVIPPHLETDFARLLRFKLSDRAYTAVEGRDFRTVDEFACRIREVFAPAETLSQLYGQLAELKKDPQESVLDYNNRAINIRDAIVEKRRANANGYLALRELESIDRDIVDGYRDGLPPEWRRDFVYFDEMTLQDAFIEVMLIEGQRERDRLKHGEPSCSVASGHARTGGARRPAVPYREARGSEHISRAVWPNERRGLSAVVDSRSREEWQEPTEAVPAARFSALEKEPGLKSEPLLEEDLDALLKNLISLEPATPFKLARDTEKRDDDKLEEKDAVSLKDSADEGISDVDCEALMRYLVECDKVNAIKEIENSQDEPTSREPQEKDAGTERALWG